MTNRLEDDLQRMIASMDSEEPTNPDKPETSEDEPQPEQTIHIHYFPDAIVILKEEQQPQVVESEPATPPDKPTQAFPYVILGIILLCLLPMLASILLQVYLFLNPPIATVTIVPKSQTVRLTGTLQMGRLLAPITISQSQITPTTGKGHQSAKQATGYLTFYNGQFQTVTIAAGTIFTGASGIQISTDQDATIPPGNPPSYGQITVSAHAITAGSRGNIPAYDINQACCATSVLAKNTQAFTGGQDERDFQTVAEADISSAATPLKISIAQSMSGALQGQLNPNEQLQLLPCSPTIASDHPIGAEATQVKVTVSQTCSAVAYNSQELQTKATTFLATQAQQKSGAGYSLLGEVQVHVTQASISHTSHPLVFLSFKASGTWIYGLSATAQERMKNLIAGKSTEKAISLLATLPGIEHATIHFDGFGDATRLPKNSRYIHISLIVM